MLRKALCKFALVLPALLPLAFCAGVAQAQAATSAAQNAAPRIDGFDVEPATRLSPGNELLFTLYGSAGGTASVRIEGVVDRFFLEEVEAGGYEGAYPIRNRDRISTLTV